MQRDCESFELLITAFVDEEINEEDSAKLERHLNECPQCSAQLEQQRGMKTLMLKRYRTDVAPVQLRAKVRRKLAEFNQVPGFWELFEKLFKHHTLKAAISVAVLVLLMVLPYAYSSLKSTQSSLHTSAIIDGTPIMLEGKAVCVDCRLLADGKVTDTAHPGKHRLALILEDGKIISFLQTEAGLKLINDESVRNKLIRVKGYNIPGRSYFKVLSYKPI